MESLIPCRCGNIKTSVRMIPPNSFPNLPSSEQERFSRCVQSFMIRGKSISIKAPDMVTTRAHSSACSDVTCTGCRTTFRFFLGQGMIIYGGVVPEGRQGALTPSPNFVVQQSLPAPSNRRPGIPRNFPNFLQPYVVPLSTQELSQNRKKQFSSSNWDSDEANSADEALRSEPNDDDFNMMFSCKIDPVVGSYKQNMWLPNDILFDTVSSEFSPSSYFA